MTTPFSILAALFFCAATPPSGSSGTGRKPPVITVVHDDTAIAESCLIDIAPDTVIEDRNQNGVLHVAADGITIRFKPGAVLRGAATGTPWDQLRGLGLRIDGHRHVTLENARIHGFKNGLVATRADGLKIQGGDFSDNYRQRLKSTPEAEDGADWLFPHHNDERKWRDEYGGAVCIESSARISVRDIRVRRGQNGVILDRVCDSTICDNDCSFLSGWGLALWRSSRNVVSRNAFDFCVRGHVEEIYNRGQDSAGILCFEQCNDNVFAENSVTHGGDGFFGFAGREAIGEEWMNRERERLRKETGRKEVDALIQAPSELIRQLSPLGCNRNLLIDNDFSYAAAHGIEMTFSEGNRLIRNRLVENAICGVWGGYSSDTLIAENHFAGNGGMAYGLERGAINMEHAAGNWILRNRFLNNKCAVHLWWDDDGALLKYPGVAGTEQGVTGNIIAQNRFEIQRDLPFRDLRPNASLLILQLCDGPPGHLTNNYYFGNRTLLDHPQAKEFAVPVGSEPIRDGKAPAYRVPDHPVAGRRRPVGARAAWRGRDQIILDEWGPWDHESPLVRSAKAGTNEHAFEIYGVKNWTGAKILEGAVTVAAEVKPRGRSIRLRVRGPSGVTPYRVRVFGDRFEKELAGTLVATEWRLKVFPWTVDPRQDLASWRRLADSAPALEATVGAIDFPYGWGGPRDLKLSNEINRGGPGNDHFGMIARTQLRLPQGLWRFRTWSDDGVRVMVNGHPIIENWTWHGPTPNEAMFDQARDGDVTVVVEHFEIDGYATLRLEIEAARR